MLFVANETEREITTMDGNVKLIVNCKCVIYAWE